jgi:ABC-type ATPase involved in cell division
MIEFTDVSKEYTGGWKALDGASFRLDRGEFTLLTGPSGAGKSTILRMIYMDEKPDSGLVTVSAGPGFDYRSDRRLSTAKVQALRRRLGIVFQDFKLLFAPDVIGLPYWTPCAHSQNWFVGRRTMRASMEIDCHDRVLRSQGRHCYIV